MLMLLCNVHLKRLSSDILFMRCLVLLPDILFLHILKLEGLEFSRMNSMTSFSLRLNWNSMASKGVLSSQAIWMILSESSKENLFTSSTPFTAIDDLFPIFFPFFSPSKRQLTNRACFGWQMLFFDVFHGNGKR